MNLVNQSSGCLCDGNKTMRLLERFHSISTDLRMRTKSSFPMRTSIKVIREYGWRCLRISSPFLFLVPKNHRWPMSPSTPTPLLHYMSRSLAKCLSRCDREIFSLLSLPSNNLSDSALCRSAPPLSPLLSPLAPHYQQITFNSPTGKHG